MESVQEQRRFNGLASALARIGREEGMVGYFKGNGTNVVRIVPYAAVQFAAYEEFKKVSILIVLVLCCVVPDGLCVDCHS